MTGKFRAPETFGEYMAAEFAKGAKCSEELVVPIPEDCPGYVHFVYSLSAWHILTIVLGLFIIVAMLQLFFQAFKE